MIVTTGLSDTMMTFESGIINRVKLMFVCEETSLLSISGIATSLVVWPGLNMTVNEDTAL